MYTLNNKKHYQKNDIKILLDELRNYNKCYYYDMLVYRVSKEKYQINGRLLNENDLIVFLYKLVGIKAE